MQAPTRPQVSGTRCSHSCSSGVQLRWMQLSVSQSWLSRQRANTRAPRNASAVADVRQRSMHAESERQSDTQANT